jgi:lipoprotein NlpI
VTAELLMAVQVADLERLQREWDAAIAAEARTVEELSRRGDAFFFLGRFDRAAADYARMVELEPARDAGHWRRGIAEYCAGRFEAAAAQFEKYHAVDDRDRENGIWRFLSQARTVGVEKAQAGLLPFVKADREPFPALYEMFAGRRTAEAVLREVEQAADGREARLFYAHLYAGLRLSIDGSPAAAAEHFQKATANAWPRTAGYGPQYMWHVGRLMGERQARLGELLKTFREEFVALKPGAFQMGGAAERPVHRVTFAAPFAIARYEVPQNLWEAVAGSNPSRWKGARNSVEMLSWNEAVAFSERATLLMRAAGLIEASERVRLPSEAEWEYAARAGTTGAYSFGDDPKELDAYAWHHGNAAGNDPPVGAKRANPWGLHDVHGYLWEWCADPWHDTYEGAPADGSVWAAGGDAERRVLRGGSWKDGAERLTSSHRRAAPRGLRDDAVGLRCVLATER